MACSVPAQQQVRRQHYTTLLTELLSAADSQALATADQF